MIKKKIFRIPLALAAEFEKACTLMGLKEREAAEEAIKDWLRKNQGQASLESYMKQGSAKPVIFQNITLQKIQVTVVKAIWADSKYVYVPYDVRVDDLTETGEHNTFAKDPTYVVLIVTPTMDKGTVDYQFKVYQK